MVTERRTQFGPWTPEEDALLLRHPELTYKEIAVQTGRTPAAVSQRMVVLRRKNANGNVPETADEPQAEEGQPITLETAVAGMNSYADKLQEMAAQLRNARRQYADLVALFEIAQVFIDKLRDQVVQQGGRTPLTDAAESFVESVEVLTLKV